MSSDFPSSVRPLYEKFQKAFQRELAFYLGQMPRTELHHEVQRLLESGGKRLRPFLCFLLEVALSGRCRHALPLGLALELFHAFCLLQDDAMDESLYRRGRLSAFARQAKLHQKKGWKKEAKAFGKNVAFLSGDLALMLCYEQLSSLPLESDRKRKVYALFQTMAKEVLQGQYLDLQYGVRSTVSVTQVRKMLLLKSGCYSVVRPMQLGALVAGRPDVGDLLEEFGRPLGVAFQMQDDYISLFGTSTGKGTKEDLKEGKKTLLLLYTLEAAPEATRKKLQKMLYRSLKESEFRWFREKVRRFGLKKFEAEKQRLLERALHALHKLPLSERHRVVLGDLASFLVERKK